MHPKGDWVSWLLQFVVGFVVGGALGFGAVLKGAGRRGKMIEDAQTSTFLWGCALVGGGLAGFFGDRLWLSDHYQILEPDSPSHDWGTKLGSITAIVSGIGLIALAFVRSH